MKQAHFELFGAGLVQVKASDSFFDPSSAPLPPENLALTVPVTPYSHSQLNTHLLPSPTTANQTQTLQNSLQQHYPLHLINPQTRKPENQKTRKPEKKLQLNLPVSQTPTALPHPNHDLFQNENS
jgi:hypothetical protein